MTTITLARRWLVRVILPDDFRTSAWFDFSHPVSEAYVRGHADVIKWVDGRPIDEVYATEDQP